MIRLASLLPLLFCFSVPLAAQSHRYAAEAPPAAGTVVVPAPPPEPSDTALAGEPLVERMVGGALVGAVTGGVLSAQDSDCAPAASAPAAILGGSILGAIRAAFGWNPSDDELRDPTDSGGVKGPYPFDGENCERADDD